MINSPENDFKEFFEEADQQEQQKNIEEELCKEKLFRLSADFANFKKRTEKERAEWMLIAQVNLLEELVPLFDELDRAIELSEQENTQTLSPATAQTSSWFEGFKLMQKNWKKKLTDLGVEEIQATGAFNPEFHEALMQVENTDKKSGEIVQVFSKGYIFKGKVIKHAKVSVAQ